MQNVEEAEIMRFSIVFQIQGVDIKCLFLTATELFYFKIKKIFLLNISQIVRHWNLVLLSCGNKDSQIDKFQNDQFKSFGGTSNRKFNFFY